MLPKRVLIQRNPTSGSGRGQKEITALISALKTAGYRVRLFSRRDSFDRMLSCPDIAASIHCLVAAGGDGTVASLVHRHPRFPVAVLPLGTENLVARYLKIPRSGTFVARMIDRLNVCSFDCGIAADQRFLVMVSSGIDADIVHRLSALRAGNISHLSYINPITRSLLKYSYPQIDLLDDDGTVLASGSHVIISNMPEYGFRFPFCPDADPTDGLLDVCVFLRRGRWHSLKHAARLRFAKPVPRDIVRFRLPRVHLRTQRDPAPVQFDGDPLGTTPITVAVDPAAMQLVVPEDFRPPTSPS